MNHKREFILKFIIFGSFSYFILTDFEDLLNERRQTFFLMTKLEFLLFFGFAVNNKNINDFNQESQMRKYPKEIYFFNSISFKNFF
jgi:hypothetical protein